MIKNKQLGERCHNNKWGRSSLRDRPGDCQDSAECPWTIDMGGRGKKIKKGTGREEDAAQGRSSNGDAAKLLILGSIWYRAVYIVP